MTNGRYVRKYVRAGRGTVPGNGDGRPASTYSGTYDFVEYSVSHFRVNSENEKDGEEE